jgi:hypothetical protein
VPIAFTTQPGQSSQQKGPKHLIHRKVQQPQQYADHAPFPWDESKHKRGAGGRFITSNTSGPEATAAAKKIGVPKLTPEAIKQFQQAHGLQVDGIIGHQTAAALAGDKNASSVQTGSLTDQDLNAILGHSDVKPPHGSKGKGKGKSGGLGKLKMSPEQFAAAARDILRRYPPPTKKSMSEQRPLLADLVGKAINDATTRPFIFNEAAAAEIDKGLKQKWDERKHPRDAQGQFISVGGVATARLDDGTAVQGEVKSVKGSKIVIHAAGKDVTVDADQVTMNKEEDGSAPTTTAPVKPTDLKGPQRQTAQQLAAAFQPGGQTKAPLSDLSDKVQFDPNDNSIHVQMDDGSMYRITEDGAAQAIGYDAGDAPAPTADVPVPEGYDWVPQATTDEVKVTLSSLENNLGYNDAVDERLKPQVDYLKQVLARRQAQGGESEPADSLPFEASVSGALPLLAELVKAFDESKHPRGKDGRFIHRGEKVRLADGKAGIVTGVTSSSVDVKVSGGKTETVKPSAVSHESDKPSAKENASDRRMVTRAESFDDKRLANETARAKSDLESTKKIAAQKKDGIPTAAANINLKRLPTYQEWVDILEEEARARKRIG